MECYLIREGSKKYTTKIFAMNAGMTCFREVPHSCIYHFHNMSKTQNLAYNVLYDALETYTPFYLVLF
jgi:hypothetical protein